MEWEDTVLAEENILFFLKHSGLIRNVVERPVLETKLLYNYDAILFLSFF